MPSGRTLSLTTARLLMSCFRYTRFAYFISYFNFKTTPRNSIESALKFAGLKGDDVSKSTSQSSSNDPNLSESAEQIAAELLSVEPVTEMTEAEAVLATAGVSADSVDSAETVMPAERSQVTETTEA